MPADNQAEHDRGLLLPLIGRVVPTPARLTCTKAFDTLLKEVIHLLDEPARCLQAFAGRCLERRDPLSERLLQHASHSTPPRGLLSSTDRKALDVPGARLAAEMRSNDADA